MFLFRRILFVLCTFMSVGTMAADAHKSHIFGQVYDISSSKDGLLLRMDGNTVPTDCIGTSSYGWMLISKEDTAMISVALAMRAQGKQTASIYVSGLMHGLCRVTQYDPHD